MNGVCGSTSSGGGGLADHNLEQTYEHPQTQSLHPPNTYVYSSRIQRVALNPVSKAAFLSLENNTAHLWALEQHTRPLHSERASSGALFAACWNPHSGTEFALGGQRRHLKVFDVRLLGHSQQVPFDWFFLLGFSSSLPYICS
jgi:WD40 repeat protein